MKYVRGPAATEEDLLRTPRDGYKYELVDGEIRASPGGCLHSHVCVQLASRLVVHIQDRQLGYAFDSNTGYRLPGGNVRVPDFTFVAKGRFPGEEVPEDFSDLPPDLAAEVLHPDDRLRDVFDRVGEYLQASVRLVWVIDPKRRIAAVYKSLTDVRSLGPEDWLEGEDVVPGFRCRLAEVVG